MAVAYRCCVSSPSAARQRPSPLGEGLPVRLLHDRVLVLVDVEAGERRSMGGIVIPATATMGKRLAWAEVVAVGGNVRTVEVGDRVLFDPDERAEVELRGSDYILLRERDIHAVAAERIQDGAPGLYL
jgi:chaperonin GroES